MRWPGLLCVVLAAAGCSKAPSPQESYQHAWTAFRQGDLQQAQDLVDASIGSNKSSTQAHEADALTLLQTEVLLARGHAHEASKLLAGLTDPHDPDLHLRLLVDRADALTKTGHPADAVPLLDEVEQTAGASTADPVFKAMLLRGAILIQDKQVDAGEAVLRNVAKRAHDAGDSFNEAATFLNFSFAKVKSDRYDQSLEYSQLASQAAEKAGAKRIVGLANNNLGIAYTVLGDLVRAENYTTTAVRQLREIGDQRNLQDSLGGLGNLRLRNGHPELAEPAYEEAITICTNIGAPEDAARWAGQYAFALIQQHKWTAADAWNKKGYGFLKDIKMSDQLLFLDLNQAAIANGLGRQQEAIQLYRDLVSKSQDSPYVLWNAHVQLASLLTQAKRLKEADDEYASGLMVIEQVTSKLLSPDARIRYHDGKMQFFRDYVDLLVEEGNPERALQVAEYSRARVLAENLGLESKTFDQVRLSALKQHAQRTGNVLLSYWMGERRSFVWVITPQGIQMKQLPGESEIAKLTQSYRGAIEDDLRDPVADDLPQGHQLRTILLDSVRKELVAAKRVVIVPDGPLHALNFETLPGADPKKYWIEEVEVSIAPSLSVLTDAPRQRVAKPSLLLIGAPQPPGNQYAPLPSAEAEIDQIQHRFDDAHRLVRKGADATPRSFLDSMPGSYSMIHFTAHAEANPQSPLESAVILSSGLNGYKLYASDIVGLKLSADLVTISACRSAGARSFGGEGLVGFAWAFLQSGAHSVIAGLWDVGDASSAKLMDNLYAGLTSGASPAASLRAAKLSFLKSGGTQRKPFYWAPYQTYIR